MLSLLRFWMDAERNWPRSNRTLRSRSRTTPNGITTLMSICFASAGPTIESPLLALTIKTCKRGSGRGPTTPFLMRREAPRQQSNHFLTLRALTYSLMMGSIQHPMMPKTCPLVPYTSLARLGCIAAPARQRCISPYINRSTPVAQHGFYAEALRAHLPCLATRAGLGRISRNSGIVRFV